MKETQFIETVLEEAAAYVRTQYARRDEVSVSSKSHVTDLLTEVDLGVQDLIVARLSESFGDDAISAEERGLSGTPDDPDGRVWVIDPIDGTQNFVRGLFPTFGISLAFAMGGRPVAGGVTMPITNDRFLAERGRGAHWNGERMNVSALDSVATARIEIDLGGPPDRERGMRLAQRLFIQAGQVRWHAAAVVALCGVASGEGDGYFHSGLCPYDYAAGQIIVEEAGGLCTRLDGSPLMLFDGKRGVLASNRRIHDELVSLVDEADAT